MIGIDRETLELIQTTAQKADGANGKVKTVELPEPDGRYLIVKADGTHELVERQPPDRRHTLLHISEVGQFTKHAAETWNIGPSVWYDADTVTILIDDGPGDRRRHRAAVHLTHTEEFEFINSLNREDWLTQKQLVAMLRIHLADCLGERGGETLRILRSINFGATTSGHGNVEHGRESLGRELESEIRSDLGEIPEVIPLAVRVYDDPSLPQRGAIRCALEIDAGRGVFQFIPMPADLREIQDEALDQIGALLESDVDAPLFRGTP